MDFELDPVIRELNDVTRKFAQKHLRWGDEVDDHERPFARKQWKLCGDQGLLGVCVPTEYGGSGLGAMAAASTMEAIGYGSDDLGFAFSIAAHLFACVLPIVKFGTSQQKDRWLPSLVQGECVAAHCISEPDAGSDAFAARTTAEYRDGGYVLNGSKSYATNAAVADLLLIHAVTRPGGGFFGLTAFLVDAKSHGIQMERPHRKIGLTSSQMADFHLEDCHVPEDQRLGAEGGGAAVFSAAMNWERVCLFAIYLGAMQRQLEETIQFAKDRKQFGAPIGTFQAVSHRIVEMKLRVESSRWMLYRAAWGLDKGEEDDVPAALAKLTVSEAAIANSLDAVQVHGGLGVVRGQVERWLRDAVPSRVYSGTSEIQRNNVARALGLTRARSRNRR